MISPGDIVEDRYRVHTLLARGGLGSVFLGESLQTGKRVVIKTVPADLLTDASHQKHVQSLFFREFQTLSALRHPGIPYLLGTGTLQDGSLYLVMEFIEGQNLDHILAVSGRVDISMALDLAEALASILGAIHAAGFVHRDIKPANILIPTQASGSPDFTHPTLVDFGVATRIEQQESARRQPEIVGTPYYMAPELLTGSGPSPASDIYSLGVLLYQVVFGVLPFGGRTATDLFQHVLSDQLDIPANVPTPRAVVKFLRQCLSRNPADRPSSGNVAADNIRAVRAQLGPRTTLESLPITPNSGLRRFSSIATVGTLVALCLIALVVSRRVLSGGVAAWKGVLVGVTIASSAVVCSIFFRHWALSKRVGLGGQVSNLLFTAESSQSLSSTLALQVDSLLEKCKLIDEKILGMTIAVMVREYGAATQSDDRQKALMNAVTVLHLGIATRLLSLKV